MKRGDDVKIRTLLEFRPLTPELAATQKFIDLLRKKLKRKVKPERKEVIH